MTVLDYLSSLEAADMFYYVFVPFIMIFAILFGILSALGVFSRKTSMIISLCLTLIVASTESFVMFSTYVAQLGAYFAFAVFGIVFFLGITMWGWGHGKEIYGQSLDMQNKIKKIDERIQKEWKEYDRTRSDYKKSAIYRRIEKLKKNKEALEAKAARIRHRR